MWFFETPAAAGTPAEDALERRTLVHSTPPAWGGRLRAEYVPYLRDLRDPTTEKHKGKRKSRHHLVMVERISLLQNYSKAFLLRFAPASKCVPGRKPRAKGLATKKVSRG